VKGREKERKRERERERERERDRERDGRKGRREGHRNKRELDKEEERKWEMEWKVEKMKRNETHKQMSGQQHNCDNAQKKSQVHRAIGCGIRIYNANCIAPERKRSLPGADRQHRRPRHRPSLCAARSRSGAHECGKIQ
jgi:hypothetical protein